MANGYWKVVGDMLPNHTDVLYNSFIVLLIAAIYSGSTVLYHYGAHETF